MTDGLNFPQVTGPEALTGAIVKDFRTRHKLSRDQLTRMTHPEVKSGARIMNIENKDSWKPGDREKVWAVMQQLDHGVTPLPIEERPRAQADQPLDGGKMLITEALGEARQDAQTTRDVIAAKIAEISQAHDDGEHEQPAQNCPQCDPGSSIDELIEKSSFGDETTQSLSAKTPDDVAERIVERANSNNVVSMAPPEWLEDTDFVYAEEPPPFESAPARVVAQSELVVPGDARVFTRGELGSADRCWRQWYLGYYRQLRLPEDDYTTLRATGDRVHRALAAWYQPEGTPRTDPREALERILTEDYTLLLKSLGHATTPYDEDTGGDPRVETLRKKFTDAANLERAMVAGYLQWIEETGADSDLRVTGPEQPLSAEVNVPIDQPPGDRDVIVAGLLDARFTRVVDGVRLFHEVKTKGDLTSMVRSLPQDHQLLHYHLLEFLNLPDADSRCDGALYTVLRRVKRSDRAKPPFYARYEIRHNQIEVESYRRHMMAGIKSVLQVEGALNAGADHHDVAPPSPTEDCYWSCQFAPVCPLFDDGSRVEDMVNALYVRADPLAHYGIQRGDSRDILATGGTAGGTQS
jgi:PD-(D/E)XK nuclease superfamily